MQRIPTLVSAQRPGRHDPSLIETRELRRELGRRGRLMVFRSAPAWSLVHWALPIARVVAHPLAS